MSGAPAETWRNFRFNTSPAWSLVFAPLICVGIGLFLTVPLMYLVGRHAAGPLPLTRDNKRTLEIPIWAGAGAIAGAALLLIVAALAFTLQHDPTNPAAALVALLAFSTAVPLLALGAVLLEVGFQLSTFYGPVAKVMKQEAGQPDRIVELRRVHPNFVAAVLEKQRARAAPGLPQTPGSN
jgi:hypothetical protein